MNRKSRPKRKRVQCKECELDVITDDEDSLACDTCTTWIHFQCTKLNKIQIRDITSNPDSKFVCHLCAPASTSNNDLKLILEKINDLTSTVKFLAEKNVCFLKSVDGRLKTLEKEKVEVKITDLPREIHHQIGFYLTAGQLKNLSLVSKQFFDFYSFPLTRITFTDLTKLIELKPSNLLRTHLNNVRVHDSDLALISNLHIDLKAVRSIQLRFSRRSISTRVFEVFVNMHSLCIIEKAPFYKTPIPVETYVNLKLRTLMILGFFNLNANILSNLKNFQKVVFKNKDLEGKDNEIHKLKSILTNNEDSLKELYIKKRFGTEDFEIVFGDGLKLEKLTLYHGDHVIEPLTHLAVFQNLKVFVIYDSGGFLFKVSGHHDLYPLVTHLHLNMYCHPNVPNDLNRSLNMPKLKSLTVLGCYCLDYMRRIDAPNIQELNFPAACSNRQDYKPFQQEHLKGKFPTVTKVHFEICPEPSFVNIIEFFTNNFKKLEVLEIKAAYYYNFIELNEAVKKVAEVMLPQKWKKLKLLRIEICDLNIILEGKDIALEGYKRLLSYSHFVKWESKINSEFQIIITNY